MRTLDSGKVALMAAAQTVSFQEQELGVTLVSFLFLYIKKPQKVSQHLLKSQKCNGFMMWQICSQFLLCSLSRRSNIWGDNNCGLD